MGQLIGVVLAGGEGRRMGRPKGTVVLGGLTLAERAANALRPLCGSVLLSVAPGMPSPTPKLATVEDAPPAFRGPLAGIEAAMAATGEADLFVLACDYAHIEAAVLRALLDAVRAGDDIVFPVDGKGRDHPLVGVWRRACDDRVRDALASRNYKVRGILADLVAHRLRQSDLPGVDLDEALRTVEHPGDLGAP